MVCQPRESVASAAMDVEPMVDYDENDDEEVFLNNLNEFMKDLYKWFCKFEKGLVGETLSEEMAKYDEGNKTWEEEFQEWFLEDY